MKYVLPAYIFFLNFMFACWKAFFSVMVHVFTTGKKHRYYQKTDTIKNPLTLILPIFFQTKSWYEKILHTYHIMWVNVRSSLSIHNTQLKCLHKLLQQTPPAPHTECRLEVYLHGVHECYFIDLCIHNGQNLVDSGTVQHIFLSWLLPISCETCICCGLQL